MKKKIIISLYFIFLTVTFLLLTDYIFSIYNENFYFRLSQKNILPALGYAILISLIRIKSWRNVAIIVLMLSTMIQFLYYEYYGDYIQPIAFIQFYNNVEEVTESLLPVINKMVIPFLVAIIIMMILVKLSNKLNKKLLNFKYSSYLIILGVVGNLIMTYIYINQSDGKLRHWQARAIYPNKKELSGFNFNKSVNYLLVGIIPKKIFGSNLSFPKIHPPSKYTSLDNNIIVVIGESLRYDRLSLFGYDKKTTPLLDSLSISNNIQHKVIYTGGTMTKTAVATILNRLKYPGTEQILKKKNNLFHLAKANGYKTHFISAQNQGSLEILEPLIGRDKIDNYMNRSDFDRNREGFTHYDEDFIPYLKEINLDDKNFIVLQQRGSHSPYRGYPEEYNKFKVHYDNTVLYTDALLTTIYNYLKISSKKETYFIYVSDHGELLGEKGKFGHGWFEPEIYEIPLIMKSINTLKKIDIEKINSHYDLSNYILSLMGYDIENIETPEKEIFVNGSDLDGLAGYIKFTFKDDSLIKKEVYR